MIYTEVIFKYGSMHERGFDLIFHMLIFEKCLFTYASRNRRRGLGFQRNTVFVRKTYYMPKASPGDKTGGEP